MIKLSQSETYDLSDNQKLYTEFIRTYLDKAVDSFINRTDQFSGLKSISGRTGIAMFLFSYSKSIKHQQSCKDLIDELVEAIIGDQQARNWVPDNFADGWAGIGWGLEFLLQNGYKKEGSTRILNQIDNKFLDAFKIEPKLGEASYSDAYIQHIVGADTLENTFLSQGLTGFGMYFLCRILNKTHTRDELRELMHREILVRIIDELARRIFVSEYLTENSLVHTPENSQAFWSHNIEASEVLLFFCKAYLADFYKVKIGYLLELAAAHILQKLDAVKKKRSSSSQLQLFNWLNPLIIIAETLGHKEWGVQAQQHLALLKHNPVDLKFIRKQQIQAEFVKYALGLTKSSKSRALTTLMIQEFMYARQSDQIAPQLEQMSPEWSFVLLSYLNHM